ncbi:MAG: hypothetical protein HRF50_16470 [Phycisphaerae bacterium]|jgi:YHS domain-containing protein
MCRRFSFGQLIGCGLAAWLAFPLTADAQVRVPHGAGARPVRAATERASRDQRGTTVVRRGPESRLRSVEGVTYREYDRRGTVIRRLPERYTRVVYGGRPYYFCDDTFYIEVGRGPSVEYVVAPPPIGAYVTYLPYGCRRVALGGRVLYTYDDVYYAEEIFLGQPRYVVVEPPLGTVVTYLPPEREIVVHRGVRHYRVGRVYYRPVYDRGSTIYVRVDLD